MNNVFLSILFLVLFISCKDQVTTKKPKKDTVYVSSLCEEDPTTGNPGNACIPSSINFGGISEITHIKEKQVTINWLPIEGIATYNIFEWKNGEKHFLRSVKHDLSKVEITGLNPDTEYGFIVNAMDESGKMDTNLNIVYTKTLSHPPYQNSKSVSFSGTKSIDLISSKSLFPNKEKFSVSLWFKTNFIQLESYLFSAHYGISSGISLAIGMDQAHFFIDYRTESGELKRAQFLHMYNDNQWHQVFVTFNEGQFKIYIDGTLKKSVNDSIVGFGTSIARLASYNGSAKLFAGLIDEVAIWKRPLNANQVSSVYNNGVASDLLLNLNSNAVAHWWRLGDGLDTFNSFIDQISDAHATGNGLIQTDIVNESP
jgi:hypothetical protein